MKCDRCGGDASKFGKTPSVKAGKKQRFRCKECGHTFYEGRREEPIQPPAV